MTFPFALTPKELRLTAQRLSAKRATLGFVQPNGHIIPFDTFNTFYRDEAEGAAVLAEARQGDHS
jgi:hypothetical protein